MITIEETFSLATSGTKNAESRSKPRLRARRFGDEFRGEWCVFIKESVERYVKSYKQGTKRRRWISDEARLS